MAMGESKAIPVIGLLAAIGAAGLSARAYSRGADPSWLAAALFFVLAAVFTAMRLWRWKESLPSAASAPERGKRTIVRFLGFTVACWLLLVVRGWGDASWHLDPVNVLILLISLTSAVLALNFWLQLRRAKRALPR
jgi:hypothetical protein